MLACSLCMCGSAPTTHSEHSGHALTSRGCGREVKQLWRDMLEAAPPVFPGSPRPREAEDKE
eukprot:15434943-Alexandrium_andersonii.AAC.1